MHQLAEQHTAFVCIRTAPRRGVGHGRGGGVFVCKNEGGGATVRLHTPNSHPPYSSAPVSPAPIIQYPKENLILRTRAMKSTRRGDGFGSR